MNKMNRSILMIALSMNKIKKTYGITSILEDISFSIREGERVALVGVNGSGKTTLFRILTGETDYDGGEIYYGKDLSLGYLSQNLDAGEGNTLLEEVLRVFEDVMLLEKELRHLEESIAEAGTAEDHGKLDSLMALYAGKTEQFQELNGYACQSEAKGILIGLGFSEAELSKSVDTLSGGEKTRLMLGKILLRKPNILLLDEPTNHLDTLSIQWLETFLKQYTGTIFVISHDRYFLDQLTTRTFEIANKKLRTYSGNYSYYIRQRQTEAEIEEKHYEENRAEIKRQQEVISKLRSFGREKQVKRARSREKLLEKIEVVDRPDTVRKQAQIRFRPNILSGKDVLQAKGLGKSYGERLLFEGVNLEIYRGEKIALIGANGTGKSTLFNILLGEDREFAGEVCFGKGVHPVYFDQKREDLNPDDLVLDAVWNSYPRLTETQIRSMLGAFLFTGDEVYKQIKSLSGGEKARISLLKLMLSDSNFLFLDEPTNHLDIRSKEILEDALCAYEGTAFVISHDRYFLNKVPDRILLLEDRKITEYHGNYDYYIEKKKMSEEQALFLSEETAPTKTQQKLQKKKDKDKEKEERKQKAYLKSLEEQIREIEETLHSLDEALCDPGIYADPEKVRSITEEQETLKAALAEQMIEWENLLLELEE